MQKSTSIAKNTGKHPRDGFGGGSDGGDVDDSNDDSVHYQYAGTGEPPDPNVDMNSGENPLDPKNRSSDANFANPNMDDPELPDLTDLSDSEDDDDHFENDKKTYGGTRPYSFSNVDELAKNAAKLSDT